MDLKVFDSPTSPGFYFQEARTLIGDWAMDETDARRRVRAVLGDRTELPLEAALYVIAQENGFPAWTSFRRHLETLQPVPPVDRIGLQPVEVYEESVTRLAKAVSGGDERALRRVRFQLPRLALRSDRQLAEQGISRSDAGHVYAREWGMRSWPAMNMQMRACARRWHADRVATGDLAMAVEAMRRNDASGLAALIKRNPGLVNARYREGTLLDLIAQPDGVGDNLGMELGIDRAVVDVLLEAGSATDQALVFAAAFNRLEFVKILLDAGAPLGDGVVDWDINALESGVMHGSTESVDAIADARGVVPNALWLAAGTGKLESAGAWQDREGGLRPEAGWHRADFTNIGLEPDVPPTDDPGEIMAEAFVHATRNGRRNAAEWLLKQGVDVNAAPYRNITPLHHAIWTGQEEMVKFLVDNGADLEARDEMVGGTPRGWAKNLADMHPNSPAIRDALVG